MKKWDDLTTEEKIDRCAEYICMLHKTKEDVPPKVIPGYTVLDIEPDDFAFRREVFGRNW